MKKIMFSYSRAENSARHIMSKTRAVPSVAVILGSGLGGYHEKLEEKIEIPYEQIPDFPDATAIGHKSRLVFGKLKDKHVIMMCGRFHYYEGYSMEQCAFPVQVFKQMGVKTLIVTNASGCINNDFEVGDLMLIKDHIKLISDSPLRGKNDNRIGPRFNDMSVAYTPRLLELAKEVAYGLGLTLWTVANNINSAI
jgi:purine-nucleoside phosphorylase